MTNGMTLLVTGNLLLGVLVIVLLLWDAFAGEEDREDAPSEGCAGNEMRTYLSADAKKSRCG